ncbi:MULTISPECIES: NIPSNAP family protein [Xanthomonas]|uniref:NIPSNAP family protein n=1 Tax=Xanthomonas dyei TaxID=743699 RepID=A0ABZ0DDM3_9XANT|nr:NIPSNAP family protein [Xanthomonas dyei]MCC4632664.1 NIPSNAP family protein [Xanthomonas dyei pv. eucalypti]WOB26134.1 NIPSNAP family protein [Xanthomonas dyei]WOB53758.1 NIPSNAP family protein [Xanthomonas dyei]
MNLRQCGIARCGTLDCRAHCLIACWLRQVIETYQLVEFEHDTRLWIPLAARFGGQHHGYLLASEGANNIALAMFSFPSLAQYDRYRVASREIAACLLAFADAERTRCVVNDERSCFGPVLA